MKNSHEFAFYVSHLSQMINNVSVGERLVIDDGELVHRIIHVVRLKVGQSIILFDDQIHIQFELSEVDRRKSITGIIREKLMHQMLKPHITVLLPLLKRDALEQAVSNLVALGVNEIQFIATKKSHRSSLSSSEYERLTRLMHSAAEQSKQFAPVQIKPVLTLESALKMLTKTDIGIWADPEGAHIRDILPGIVQPSAHKLVLLLGPEADFTPEEKEFITQHQFIRCALTSTVLESWLAVTLLAGMCRSWMR